MAQALQPGNLAPTFELSATTGTVRLADLIAKGKVVVAFYTEDATPTCSAQVTSFKDEFATFKDLGAQVVAISADSVESHQRFAQSLGGVPFPLASDASLEVAKRYGVADETSKRSRRAVFVVGQDGKVLHANAFYNLGNPGHYMDVFKALGLEM